MPVTTEDILGALEELDISRGVVCLHASLSSFGLVSGGSGALLDAFLATGTTLLVPSFSWDFFGLWPAPPGMRPARNGTGYQAGSARGTDAVFSPDSEQIDADMGVVPSSLLGRTGRVRGNHPLCSFTAVGPLAREVISEQTPVDVFAPLRVLRRLQGTVVLAGVGLNRLTLLHHAEEMAGRTLFRRWARLSSGRVGMVAVGGCSEGFPALSQTLAPVQRSAVVGHSRWLAFDAEAATQAAAAVIAADPDITHCASPECERCADAIAGGPLL